MPLRPDVRDDAVAAAIRMQQATAGEQGCLEYRFSTPIDDPDRLLLFERWSNRSSLDAHLGTSRFAEFRTAMREYAQGPVVVTWFEVDRSGPLL